MSKTKPRLINVAFVPKWLCGHVNSKPFLGFNTSQLVSPSTNWRAMLERHFVSQHCCSVLQLVATAPHIKQVLFFPHVALPHAGPLHKTLTLSCYAVSCCGVTPVSAAAFSGRGKRGQVWNISEYIMHKKKVQDT